MSSSDPSSNGPSGRFGRAELAPLWAEARRRFEAGTGPVTRLTLRGLTPEQRSALADLLGLPSTPGETHVVSVSSLDAILLASPARLDTRGIVIALGGPLVDRAAERRRTQAARDELWRWLGEHPVLALEPALQPWVAWARSTGLVGGDLARTRSLIEAVLRVLAALPAGGEPLPTFAATVLGDPHALDDGTRLAAYVQRALAIQHDRPYPTDAAERRSLWHDCGIACDDLSTTVIVAGLRPTGDDPLAATLRLWADAGQAVAVTLAQLRRFSGLVSGAVFVVENPSIVASALGRFGPACPPLVCVSGWPNTAAVTLLRHMAGARLYYHGDLDGEGLRIAAHVMAKTGAVPWRMSTRDYLASVMDVGPPVGRTTPAPWDASLADAMTAHGVSVPEEQVVNHLLEDLSDWGVYGAFRE